MIYITLLPIKPAIHLTDCLSQAYTSGPNGLERVHSLSPPLIFLSEKISEFAPLRPDKAAYIHLPNHCADPADMTDRYDDHSSVLPLCHQLCVTFPTLSLACFNLKIKTATTNHLMFQLKIVPKLEQRLF